MRTQLPSISSGSTTPTILRNSQNRSFIRPRLRKSERIVSVSPPKISKSKNDSSDSPLNLRPISDEVKSSLIEKDTLLAKMYSKVSKSSKGKIISKYIPNLNNFSEVIDALFSIFKCEQSRVQAHSLISLFISLGYCESAKELAKIMGGICEEIPLEFISFSRIDLLRLCDDWKTEHILRILKKECEFMKPNDKTLEGLIYVIKIWWNRLDKSKNGYVNFDEVLNLFHEQRIVENVNDIKRISIKLSKRCNFDHFFSIFSRSLLKFCMEELANIIREGSSSFLSGEISIITERRKKILNSLAGNNKIIAAMSECREYN
jgi:hypothetical protein